MTQRNPMNERYTGERQPGQTRRSAASAKPTAARAATLRDPSPKSKKQKKAEQQERERKIAERRGATGQQQGAYSVPTPEYRMWRRRYWAAIIVSLVLAVSAMIWPRLGGSEYIMILMFVLTWAGIIIALWIDMGKCRKIRNQYYSQQAYGKSKAERAQQKQHAAELREQKKAEALAAAEAAKNPQPKKKGILDRLFGRSKDAQAAGAAAETAAPAEEPQATAPAKGKKKK